MEQHFLIHLACKKLKYLPYYGKGLFLTFLLQSLSSWRTALPGLTRILEMAMAVFSSPIPQVTASNNLAPFSQPQDTEFTCPQHALQKFTCWAFSLQGSLTVSVQFHVVLKCEVKSLNSVRHGWGNAGIAHVSHRALLTDWVGPNYSHRVPVFLTTRVYEWMSETTVAWTRIES